MVGTMVDFVRSERLIILVHELRFLPLRKRLIQTLHLSIFPTPSISPSTRKNLLILLRIYQSPMIMICHWIRTSKWTQMVMVYQMMILLLRRLIRASLDHSRPFLTLVHIRRSMIVRYDLLRQTSLEILLQKM